MANLILIDDWVDGIYQLETSDPVMGGPDGIDNKQAKQLGARTNWLKKQVDEINEARIGYAIAEFVGNAITQKADKTKFESLYDLLIGIPLPWPHHHIPTGCLAMAGQTFDGGRYPKLHERYAGKLPDLRGMFIRGYDNGRGIDLAHALLQEQGDAIRNILGAHVTNTMHAHGAGDDYTAGAFSRNPVALSIPSILTKQPVLSNVSYHEFVTFDASRVVPTAEDNRPRNIAFQYICLAE